MPKSLAADWNLAQVLYVEGEAYADIAERVGVTPATLRQHAKRHGWKQLRQDALAAVSRAVTKSLLERARDTRNRLAEEVERQAGLLTECPPKSLAELANKGQGRTAVVRTIAQTAADVFGWQPEQVSQPLLTVGRVENLALQLNVGPAPVAPATVFPDRAQPAAPSDLPGPPASA